MRGGPVGARGIARVFVAGVRDVRGIARLFVAVVRLSWWCGASAGSLGCLAEPRDCCGGMGLLW